MRITDAIIVFFIIACPFFFFTQAKSENTAAFVRENQLHEGAVTNAANDAITALSTNVTPTLERGYDTYKYSPADPNLAYDTFMESLAINYQVRTENSKRQLENYVPVFAVLDYDGLLLNVFEETVGKDNEKQFERVWLPKIPFSYSDEIGNVINFTVGNEVEIYDKALNEWYEGTRQELAQDTELSIPLLKDEENFEKIKQQKIVSTMQEQFAYYINKHNNYTKRIGITYKFAMPLIEQDDWYNTISNISIFAFFQGYEYEMGNQVYEEFAFVGAHTEKKDRILAGVVDGKRRFWNETCTVNATATEVYSNKKAAAKAGYSELSCLNPTK